MENATKQFWVAMWLCKQSMEKLRSLCGERSVCITTGIERTLEIGLPLEELWCESMALATIVPCPPSLCILVTMLGLKKQSEA